MNEVEFDMVDMPLKSITLTVRAVKCKCKSILCRVVCYAMLCQKYEIMTRSDAVLR